MGDNGFHVDRLRSCVYGRNIQLLSKPGGCPGLGLDVSILLQQVPEICRQQQRICTCQRDNSPGKSLDLTLKPYSTRASARSNVCLEAPQQHTENASARSYVCLEAPRQHTENASARADGCLEAPRQHTENASARSDGCLRAPRQHTEDACRGRCGCTCQDHLSPAGVAGVCAVAGDLLALPTVALAVDVLVIFPQSQSQVPGWQGLHAAQLVDDGLSGSIAEATC